MRTFYRNISFTAGVWLATRLLLAYEFLPSGWGKLFGPGSAAWVGPQAGAAVSGFLNRALTLTGGEHPSVFSWYAGLIQSVFLPNAVLLSYLVPIGEVLVGIALVVGMFTRFATAMAFVMNMAFFYAGTVSSLPYVLPLEIAIMLLGTYAGYYGVDGLVLAKRFPWFRLPREGEAIEGATKLWDQLIPVLVVVWVVLLLVAIVGH